MKKVLYLVVGILLAAFILPSCNSSLSITKRRYNKGYFVQHTKNKRQVDKQTAAYEKKNSVKIVEDFRATEFVQPAIVKAEPSETERVTAAANTKRPTVNKSELPAALPFGVAMKDPVKSIATVGQLMKMADTGDDAMSLLWIVVVVILIVYLLGILLDWGGGGGLIHILGVIALVLLILWLLKII